MVAVRVGLRRQRVRIVVVGVAHMPISARIQGLRTLEVVGMGVMGVGMGSTTSGTRGSGSRVCEASGASGGDRGNGRGVRNWRDGLSGGLSCRARQIALIDVDITITTGKGRDGGGSKEGDQSKSGLGRHDDDIN